MIALYHKETTMGITVGVIGCGSISRFHFAALEKIGAKVKWVCDLSPQAASPWVARTGAKYTADYRDIMGDPDVQAVEVLTISSTHKTLCTAAIEAGKAVICEKTLAENPSDAAEIVRLAQAKKTILYTSYMKRFIPAVAQAKALMPRLGRIMSSSIRAFQPWGLPWDEVPAGSGFFQKPGGGVSEVRRRYGGGILVCGGSHILDLTCFFLGRPRKVYATMHTPKGADLDIQAAAMLETDNGVVHYEALAHPLGRIGFLRDGWDERIEINGAGGRLEVYSALWDQCEHKASMLVHYDNGTGAATEYRYPAGSPFDAAVAFFCDNIVQGTQGAQPVTTGSDVDELIAAIGASSASGQAVEMKYRV